MKRAAILIALITLLHIAYAQDPSFKTRSEHEQLMLRIQREKVDPTMGDLMEIREYTHTLFKKYLPDYKFYLAYTPTYTLKIRGLGVKEEEVLLKATYLTGLGVVDRENRFSLFSNNPTPFLDLGRAFLKDANITRAASSRTDGELKEIASMYLILSSLKGLNGFGVLALTDAEDGLTTVRYVKPEEFTLNRGKNNITASYKIDNDRETLECSLSFDLNGNVTDGRAIHWFKVKSL